jgi:hypothetical protein
MLDSIEELLLLWLPLPVASPPWLSKSPRLPIDSIVSLNGPPHFQLRKLSPPNMTGMTTKEAISS